MYSPQPAPHSCQGPGSDSQTSPGKVRCTVADSNPKNWLPHKYTRLDNSSNEVLCDLLAALEPITFSKFALRAIRTNKMKTLLELIEFACKVPRTTPLVGDLRHIASLKTKLKVFAAGVDCRSHRIMLRPDWNAQGVYTLRADAHDNIVVSHRYTGTSRPWPAALRLKDDDGVAIASGHLYISGNFYEDAAEVRSGLTMESFRIGNLGCFDLRLEPPLKAMRLMVGDATSSDGVSGAGLALEDGRSVTSQSTPPRPSSRSSVPGPASVCSPRRRAVAPSMSSARLRGMSSATLESGSPFTIADGPAGALTPGDGEGDGAASPARPPHASRPAVGPAQSDHGDDGAEVASEDFDDPDEGSADFAGSDDNGNEIGPPGEPRLT